MERNKGNLVVNFFLEKIKHTMNSKGINQAELCRMCRKAGYQVTQSELSRLLNGQTNPRLSLTIAVCDVLDIKLDPILHPENEKWTGLELNQEMFIVSASEPECKAYIGEFHVIFQSTDPQEDKIVHGNLIIDQSADGICVASLALYTGEAGTNDTELLKRYRGQFIISPKLGVAYCILVNNKSGEICMIGVRHRTFFYKQVECRIGLVLSISAGERKNPVANKIFLYRRPLTAELEKRLVHTLKVNDGGIFVEAGELQKLCDLNEDRDIYQKLAEMMSPELYYFIDEGLIASVCRKSGNQVKSRIISTLKSVSEQPFVMRLEENEDEYMFDAIQVSPQSENKEIEHREHGK